MQEVSVEDWIRVHRELLEAEKAFSERLRQFGEGEISQAELQEIKETLQAKRELTDAISAHVMASQGMPAPTITHLPHVPDIRESVSH